MSRRDKHKPNLGDPSYQRKVKDTEKHRRQQLEASIRFVMGSEQGRKVLMWIIYGVCALENGGIDALGNELLHFTGRRWVGREVLAKCTEISPGTMSRAIAEEHLERANLAQYQDVVEDAVTSEEHLTESEGNTYED